MKKKQFCKNHPEKPAHRKCYYCKDYICSECQQHMDKHLFCSKKCYYSWKAVRLYSRFKPYKQLLIFIFLLLVSDIVILLLNSDKSKGTVEQNIPLVIPDTSNGVVVLSSDRMVVNNKIIFTVMAPENTVVILSKNGRFTKTIITDKSNSITIESFLDIGQNIYTLYALQNSNKSTLIDSISINYYSKRIKFLEHPVYQVNTKQKLLALTFDGGSLDRGAENIIDTLRAYNMSCTIFLTGNFIRHFPDLVKKMVNDGHEIGNHSFSHPHLTQLEINGSTKTLDKVDNALIYHQLTKADSLFNLVSGRHFAPFWRAPYGEFNKEIIEWAALSGYKHIGWSAKCDTWDWVADSTSEIYRTNIEILARLLMVEKKYGLNGKIILMHLGSERQGDMPYKILGKMITEIRKRGYKFIKVSELINLKE